MSKLTEKEQLYLSIIKAKHGVLYLQSSPGCAKSAILKSIADKMNWQYIDLRLSQLDPIAVGMFPSISTTESGMKVLDFTVPKWAILANTKPTLINFDELNRASLDTLKAAMQLFNERTIGTQFKFNNDVYMCATGNIGEEDLTDVTDLDSAMHGRLIHIRHSLSAKEWLDWGTNKLHSMIKLYIQENPQYLYDKAIEGAYASPRTWHYLSEYIITNYGHSILTKDQLANLAVVIDAYIGKSQGSKFLAYCNKLISLSLKDILEMSNDTLDYIDKCVKNNNTITFSLIIYQFNSLKVTDIQSLTEVQCNNINTFVSKCTKEQQASLLSNIMQKDFDLSSNPQLKKNISLIFKGHSSLLKQLVNYGTNIG